VPSQPVIGDLGHVARQSRVFYRCRVDGLLPPVINNKCIRAFQTPYVTSIVTVASWSAFFAAILLDPLTRQGLVFTSARLLAFLIVSVGILVLRITRAETSSLGGIQDAGRLVSSLPPEPFRGLLKRWPLD